MQRLKKLKAQLYQNRKLLTTRSPLKDKYKLLVVKFLHRKDF